jgi:23S rRNA (pseudouridine1915-N3)-methyltransferase
LISLKGQQHPKRSISEIKSLESKLISSKIKQGSFTIAFDLNGKELDSIEFSKLIKECSEKNKITNFLIGGSFGLSQEVISSSDASISISKMTFPHRLFKVLLVEQIYRSFSILNNSPYHK